MLKKLTTPLLLFLCILSIPSFFYFYYSTQTVEAAAGDRINYELPYPGILPGNPLYSIKSARDSLLQWMMRDNYKKAQLRIQISDKNVRGAQMLSKDKQYDNAEKILIDGETIFEKAIDDTINAKEQGASPTSEFKTKMKTSNLKHKEIISDIMKSIPESERAAFKKSLEQNNENAQKLQSHL
ncbi:hypothetical protein HYS00_01565 [Candidatus Microgenomates bacterium]|nr:hypothetical protein [Candidatus Microgenomates bacterium]